MSNSTRSVILHSDSGRLRSMDNQDAKGHRHRGKDDGALKRRKTEFFPTETLVELFLGAAGIDWYINYKQKARRLLFRRANTPK